MQGAVCASLTTSNKFANQAVRGPASEISFHTLAFLASILKGWVLWTMLRWSLGCRYFWGVQHLWKDGRKKQNWAEEAVNLQRRSDTTWADLGREIWGECCQLWSSCRALKCWVFLPLLTQSPLRRGWLRWGGSWPLRQLWRSWQWEGSADELHAPRLGPSLAGGVWEKCSHTHCSSTLWSGDGRVGPIYSCDHKDQRRQVKVLYDANILMGILLLWMLLRNILAIGRDLKFLILFGPFLKNVYFILEYSWLTMLC